MINKNTQKHKSGIQGITETMPKTRSLHSLTNGPLRNSGYSFGEGHLDCLTDKEGRNKRNVRICNIRGEICGTMQKLRSNV